MCDKFKTDGNNSNIGEVVISVGIPKNHVYVRSMVYCDIPPFEMAIIFGEKDSITFNLNKNEANLLKHILEERIDINDEESFIEVTDICEDDYNLKLYHEGPKVIFIIIDKMNNTIIQKVAASNRKMISAIKIISEYMFD